MKVYYCLDCGKFLSQWFVRTTLTVQQETLYQTHYGRSKIIDVEETFLDIDAESGICIMSESHRTRPVNVSKEKLDRIFRKQDKLKIPPLYTPRRQDYDPFD